METSIKEAVSKLINLLDAQYIYMWDMHTEEEEQTLLMVLLQEGDPDLAEEMVALTGMAFRENFGILLRIYSLSYAERLIREGNLFFSCVCASKNLVYRHSGQHVPAPGEGMDLEKVFAAAKRNFDKEMAKVKAFREGAVFFEEKGNCPQAAFMLHQSVELGFRLAELLAMGKEKICHSIEGHCKYVKVFIPELHSLFRPEEEEDTPLLPLLDRAYKGVRYGRDYRIVPEQLSRISAKSDEQLAIVNKLFRSRWEGCRGEAKKEKNAEEEPPEHPSQELENVKRILKGLMKNKFYKLRPNSDNIFYKADLMLDNPVDTLSHVSSLIKVCIMALEYPGGNFPGLIPQPHINLQSALELIVQLLPYEEMEYLEDIMNAFEDVKIPLK